MPREIEYQLRAILAALCLFVGTSVYDDRFRENFWSNALGCVASYFFACLILLWWRGPHADLHPLIEAIKELGARIKRAFNGRDMDTRQRQHEERERDNG